MTAYTFELKRTDCASAEHEADDLHAAIKACLDARAKAGDGFLVKSVEWDGGEAELHGRCEACPTECVTVFEGYDESTGITENFHKDGDGIRLCKPVEESGSES